MIVRYVMASSIASIPHSAPVPVIHVGNPARELMRKLTRVFFRYIHTRDMCYSIHVGGKEFLVFPGVFTPRYRDLISLKASELLAQNLKVPAGAQVLDLGTGIGIQGIFAADRAAKVIATDINPSAIRCARANMRRLNITNLEVRCGDLFEPVKGMKFDFICWLPPSFFDDPRDMSERAFMCGHDGELLTRFCREAATYLNPGGVIQFSCVDRTRQFLLPLLQSNGFRLQRISFVRRLPMETITQYLAWPS